jgi:energy-coupling factor transport system ATP-binding protein
VLVLDEPTSQLDPQAAEEVLTTLQKLNSDLGLTIVLSEHRLERVVQYADRMMYLPGQGESPLIGTPSQVLMQVDLVPPLIQVAKELEWRPLPLTIKEGLLFARQLSALLQQDQAAERNDGSAEIAPKAVVDVRDVWFSYNGHEALTGLTLSIAQGEFVALMGRNGSGKTTLLKQIVGLLRPDRGRVELWGEDTREKDVEELARSIGYVPQNPGAVLFADTLRDELDFTRRSHGLPTGGYDDLLHRLHLLDFVDSYPRDLSGGERQRAAMAAILVADPDVILLDEPTRGLDYEQKQSLARYLRDMQGEGKTVLMSTHDVELVAQCADRVVILGEGEIVVDGPTREVMSNSMVFSSQISKLFRDNRFIAVADVLRAMER